MRRLLLVLALLVLLAAPVVSAIVSPVKTTFQDYPVITPPATYEDWYFPIYGPTAPNTYGQVYVVTGSPSPGPTRTAPKSSFTYGAVTFISQTPNQGFQLILYNSAFAVIGTSPIIMGTSGSRIEVKINSTGYPSYYNDGTLISTGSRLASNPVYFGTFGNGVGYVFDDAIVGYIEDSTIIGTIPSDWFVRFSSTSPASSGLYQVNSSGGDPILKNSYYFSVSYGRSIADATTLNIVNPSGTVIKAYTVANLSCECILPISDLMVDGVVQNGLWRVTLADDAETSYFLVMGSGAEGAWSQESYTQGDTATFTYTILDSSWDTGTSTYRFDTFDVYGNVVDTQSITTQTGSKSVTTDSTKYPSGVYYGAVIRTTSGEDTWLAADAMEVSEYIKYVGGIYDAESEAQITSSVTVTINQGGITDTTYTETGVYNSTDGLAFGTGSLTTFTVSASGYQTSVTSFTPMIAKTITKNITLIRSSPTCPTGICLGGLANETIYSRPVPAVTIAVTNATHGESYTTSTNSVGWYNLGESDGVFFTNGRCYSVTASKPGYTGNTYLKCVVGT